MVANNGIGHVMVSMLILSVVDCGFAPRSGQIKDYKICICCFFGKHAALKNKSHYWLTIGSRTMCPSRTICLSADCCYSELALYKPN